MTPHPPRSRFPEVPETLKAQAQCTIWARDALGPMEPIAIWNRMVPHDLCMLFARLSCFKFAKGQFGSGGPVCKVRSQQQVEFLYMRELGIQVQRLSNTSFTSLSSGFA